MTLYVASDIVQITSEVSAHGASACTSMTRKALSAVRCSSSSTRPMQISRCRPLKPSPHALFDRLRGALCTGRPAARVGFVRARDRSEEISANDYARRQALVADGAVSGEELAHAQDRIAQTRDHHRRRRATSARCHARADRRHDARRSSPTCSRQLAAWTPRRVKARLCAVRPIARSPVAGNDRQARRSGTTCGCRRTLLAVVPLDDVGSTPTSRESQLKSVRASVSPVAVHADIYGKDEIEYKGTVGGPQPPAAAAPSPLRARHRTRPETGLRAIVQACAGAHQRSFRSGSS